MDVDMSTKILSKSDNILSVNILSLCNMAQTHKEDLADYVRRIRTEKRLTAQDIENKTKKGITRGYVSQIENRHSINVTPNKLKALAVGLGVPVEEIFSRARGSKSTQDEAGFQGSFYYMLYQKHINAPVETQHFISKLLQMIDRELDRSALMDSTKNEQGAKTMLPVTSPGNQIYRKDTKRTGEY